MRVSEDVEGTPMVGDYSVSGATGGTYVPQTYLRI